MGLSNIKQFNTASDAAKFALALRTHDSASYNIEGIGGRPFSMDELRPHFVKAGYTQYRRPSLKLSVTRPSDRHAEAFVQLERAHQHAAVVLTDFVQRIDDPPRDKVDPAIVDKHNAVREFRNKNLLKFDLQLEHLRIFCTAFSGPRFPEHGVSREDVLLALILYMAAYFIPLRYETAGRGQFLIHEKGHLHDPENPHDYPHVHVFHKDRGYKTTIRISV